jgi:hypothetical protein
MYALICVEKRLHQRGDLMSSSRVTLMAANSMMAAVYPNLPLPNSCLISSEIARNLQVAHAVVCREGKANAGFPLGQKKR